MKLYTLRPICNPAISDKYMIGETYFSHLWVIHMRALDGFKSLVPHLLSNCRLTKKGIAKLKLHKEVACTV